jgi:predicted nucleotidyltransferase
MPDSKEKPSVTIHLSGGMIQDVYTPLESDIDVAILDFDDNGTMTDEERAKLEKSLALASSKHRQIY